jgi:tetratricopeptide (TPR) repeat protein
MNENITREAELNQMAINLMKAGNLEDAIEYLNEAEEENPNYKDTYRNRGIVYAGQKKYEQALEEFQNVLKLDKKDSETYIHLAQVNLILGRFREGIVNYNFALEYGEPNPEIYFNLGRAYLEIGEEEKANRNFNKAIELNPIEGKYYVAKVRILMQKERWEEALEVLAELNHYCPDAYEAYHYSFLIYMYMGEYEKADEIINIGLKSFPTDISLYYDKLRILNVVKEFDAALELIGLLEKVPGFEVEERNIRLEEARVYLQTERGEEAVELLEKVINMDGATSFEAHYLLMNTYLSMDRLEDAVRIARIMIAANDYSAYARSAFYYEPMCLMKLGKTAEAKQSYKRAIGELRTYSLKNPADLDAYLFRALCYKDIEEYDKAISILDYVLKLKSDFAPAHLIKSNVYRDMGKNEEAQRESNMVRETDKDLADLITSLQ